MNPPAGFSVKEERCLIPPPPKGCGRCGTQSPARRPRYRRSNTDGLPPGRSFGASRPSSDRSTRRSLADDERRNGLILDDVISSLEAGRSSLVLTERRDYLAFLADRLRSFTKHLIVLKGGGGAKKRQEALATLAAIPDGAECLILATGRYIGEGFDDARLDTLFLTMPNSWRGTLVQYTGRLHRLHPGKTEVRIYDYANRRVPVLNRMHERRLAGYPSIGYDLSDEAVSGSTNLPLEDRTHV